MIESQNSPSKTPMKRALTHESLYFKNRVVLYGTTRLESSPFPKTLYAVNLVFSSPCLPHKSPVAFIQLRE